MQILKHGIDGFLLFFTIIVLAKLLNYLIIGDKVFLIDEKDFYLALLGFVYVILLKSIEKFRKPLDSKFNKDF